MGEEQEGLAGANGGDDDAQEGSEVLPEGEGELGRCILLLWVEGEEACVGGKIRLRPGGDGDGAGGVGGGKKGGAEDDEGGDEDEDEDALGLAGELGQDGHRPRRRTRAHT